MISRRENFQKFSNIAVLGFGALLPGLPADRESLPALPFLYTQAGSLRQTQGMWAPGLQAGVEFDVSLPLQWRYLQNIETRTGSLLAESSHLIASELFQWGLGAVAFSLNRHVFYCGRVNHVKIIIKSCFTFPCRIEKPNV